MSVLTKIKALDSTLTATEKQIAEFFLKHAESIKELSSQQLADKVGVSQSSIVKFTQKLGFKGYSAMRFALVEAVNTLITSEPLLGEITLQDNVAQLNEKLLKSKINVLTETSKINEQKTLELGVGLIKSAKRILVCGIGASGLVAQDLCHKLQKVGLAATAETNGHIQLAYAATFGPNDLVICISESGLTSDILAVAELVHKKQSNVLSITGIKKSKLHKVSNVKLFTIAETNSIRLSSILSRTSQEFIVDSLFLILTQSSSRFRAQVELSNSAVKDFINR